jgi:hypothetical protein
MLKNVKKMSYSQIIVHLFMHLFRSQVIGNSLVYFSFDGYYLLNIFAELRGNLAFIYDCNKVTSNSSYKLNVDIHCISSYILISIILTA